MVVYPNPIPKTPSLHQHAVHADAQKNGQTREHWSRWSSLLFIS